MNFFRDIVIGIKMALNSASASAVKSQIQGTLAAATNPRQATRNIGILQGSVLSLARSVRNLGYMFVTYLGGRALFQFFRDATEEFNKFDRGLQRSIAIMEGVNGSIKKEMAQTALQVSRELNIAATDIAEAYYFLASAGLTAEQSLKALPAVALFAKSGLLDLNTATELLAQSQSALGMRSDDANENLAQMVRLMDVLAMADNQSQASIEDFAAALTNKAGASLRLFNKDVEEGGAALAILADQGVKGRIAGERLDIFIRQVTQSAVRNREEFEAYGIQVFDSAGKMRNFADIADDLTRALGHLSDEQQVVALEQLGFQVRTVAVVKQFIGMGDRIREYEADLRRAGGTTRRMADTQLEAFGEKLGLIKQRFLEASIELGESLMPAVIKFADAAGDESDPHSLVNVIRNLSAWLGEGGGAAVIGGGLSFILKGLIWFVNGVVNSFHMLANVIVSVVNVPLIVFSGIVAMSTMLIGNMVDWVGKLATALGFENLGSKLKSAGDQIKEFAEKADRFAMDRTGNLVQNFTEFIRRGSSLVTPIAGPGARNRELLTEGLEGATGNPKDAKGGDAFEFDGEEKENEEERLLDRLRLMRAKFNAEDTESNLERLRQLQADFREFYGKNIPKEVEQGLEDIESIIQNDGAALAMGRVFEDIYENAEPTPENIFAMQDFLDELQRQQDLVEEDSVAWEEYGKIIDRVRKKLKDLADEIKEANEERKKEQEDADAKALEERMERIRRIGERTADRLADAFGNFFNVLLIGSKRGVDAFETLGRGILAAMIAPLGEYAMLRAREAFADSAVEVAKGIAALANPLTSGLAGGHFLAAAKFAGAGALWAALGGGVNMAGAAITSGSPGMGNANPRRSRYDSTSRVDDSRRDGPEIHIFLDGIDPTNPRHQNLVGKTAEKYRERFGGDLVYHGKRK